MHIGISVGRPRRRWVGNINMDLRETVNTVMNPRVP
jgi:hypothetical protein